jgi:uncharacterized protein (TIGR04141 family)
VRRDVAFIAFATIRRLRFVMSQITDTGSTYIPQQGSAATSVSRFLPLTVLMLKPSVTIQDLQERLSLENGTKWYSRNRDTGSLVPNRADETVRLQAAVRRSPGSQPSWKALLSGFGLELEDLAGADTEAALIVVRCVAADGSLRLIVYCFGKMSVSIPTEFTDSRFGLVVALNKQCAGSEIGPWRDWNGRPRRRRLDGDPANAVRSITADARTGYRHRINASAAGPTPINGLRIDTESDHLRGLRLHTSDDLMHDLHGARSLRFATPIDSLDHFEQLADHLVTIRERDDYRHGWEWIDDIVPVDSGPEFDRVTAEFIGRIGTSNEPYTELLMPDLSEDDDSAARRILVSFPGETGYPQRVLPTWTELQRWLLNPVRAQTPARMIQRGQLRFALEGDPIDRVKRFDLIDLLAAELDVDGVHYTLSEGMLFRVDTEIVTKVDVFLDNIPTSTFPFPPYTSGTENDYLKNAVKHGAGRLALLDRTSIILPGQKSFEPCDLVTDEGTLVFAKPKGQSSSFSHLCTQVMTSAILFRESDVAREALLSRTLTATLEHTDPSRIAEVLMDRLIQLHNREPGCVTLCLAILGTWNGPPTVRALPLLSRMALRKAIQTLQELGYRVEFALPAPQLRALTSAARTP